MRELEYPPMLTPAEDCEPGSPEWALSLTYRAESSIDSVEKYDLPGIIDALRKLFAEGQDLPWNILPKDKPWKSAGPWIKQVFGTDWKVFEPVIAAKDSELANRISACLNPGEKTGRPESNDNIITYAKRAEQGTSKSYTLNRLSRDHKELFDRVVAGELSANAAAIEAGFRKVKLAPEQAMHWLKKCTLEERADIMQQLVSMD